MATQRNSIIPETSSVSPVLMTVVLSLSWPWQRGASGSWTVELLDPQALFIHPCAGTQSMYQNRFNWKGALLPSSSDYFRNVKLNIWMLGLILIYTSSLDTTFFLKESHFLKWVKRICCLFILTKWGKLATMQIGIETIEYFYWVLIFTVMPFYCSGAMRDFKVSINEV